MPSSSAVAPRLREQVRLLLTTLVGLAALVLSGCASSGRQVPVRLASSPDLHGSPGSGLSGHDFRVLGPAVDPTIDGSPIADVFLVGYDSAGKPVFGPEERAYSQDMDFGTLPPEINSATVYAAANPYVSWMSTAAAQAEQAAARAQGARDAYESAFAATVPPEAIAANKAQLAGLVATNFLGQNTPAIASIEEQYAQMWVNDVTSMHGYHTGAIATGSWTGLEQDVTPDGVITVSLAASGALPSVSSRAFPVEIVNNSAYPDDQVFLSVEAKNQAQSAYSYLHFGPNDRTRFEPFGGVDQATEYSQQLSRLTRVADHRYLFECPYDALVCGRIYLSFGSKLQSLGLANPADPLSLTLPSPTGGPDAQTLFTFVELSATSTDGRNYTLFANTSVVDFFSVGLDLTLDSEHSHQPTSQTVGFVGNARNKVLAAFENPDTPPPFRVYVKKDATDSILRVLSPVQGVALEPNGALAHFLDPAIDSGWSHYASQALSIPDTIPTETYGYKWTGMPVVDGILSMTCVAKPPGDTGTGELQSLAEVCNLPKPTTRTIFLCDDDQPLPPGTPVRDSFKNAGSLGHKRLCSLISSALNRGVFENYPDWGDASKFYTRSDGLYNHYAEIMHRYAINGEVYAFGYDDVYGQDPILSADASKVDAVIITIPGFSKM